MTTTTSNGQTGLINVPPNLVSRWLTERTAVLVDVREDFEHAQEHIAGAENWPLSRLDPAALQQHFGDQRVVFHCRSGKRSAEAAARCRCGDAPVFQLAGGIEAWKNAGLGTQRLRLGPKIDVMRQVQMVAGGLVLAGVLLGAFASPWFLLLSGFVGAGLMFAGATGFCGMAILLARMPWNRTGATCSNASPRP